MLTALTLGLAGLLAPPQDSAVAVDATASDPGAQAQLRAAAARIYRPEEHGLVSLGFVVPFEETRESLEMMAARRGMAAGSLAEVERLADVRVHWTAGEEPAVAVDLPAVLPAPMADMREQLQAALPQMGQQLLTASRGRVVDLQRFLTHYDVAAGGEEQGLGRFVLTRKAEATEIEAPAAGAEWFLDAEGLPARSTLQVEQSTPMGVMTVTMTTRHHWKPTGLGDGLVLLDRVTVEMDMGYMGSQTQTTVYHHEIVSGFPVVVGLTEQVTRSTPQGDVPPTERSTRLEELLVNGVARGN